MLGRFAPFGPFLNKGSRADPPSEYSSCWPCDLCGSDLSRVSTSSTRRARSSTTRRFRKSSAPRVVTPRRRRGGHGNPSWPDGRTKHLCSPVQRPPTRDRTMRAITKQLVLPSAAYGPRPAVEYASSGPDVVVLHRRHHDPRQQLHNSTFSLWPRPSRAAVHHHPSTIVAARCRRLLA